MRPGRSPAAAAGAPSVASSEPTDSGRLPPLAALQRRAGNAAAAAFAGAPQSLLAEPADLLGTMLNRSRGRRLHPDLARSLEAAFGEDFSRVRIHDDAIAAAGAAAVGARAFATGDRIVLSRPALAGDRRLLAHEIAHVLQSRHGSPGVAVGPVNGGHEHAARAAAAAFTAAGAGVDAGRAAHAPPGQAAAAAALAAAGPVPLIQRDDGPAGELRVPREVDELIATITEAASGAEHAPTSVLIANVERLHARFQSPEGPRSTAAYAQALIGIRQELLRREGTAPRAADGALLYEDITGSHPWTPERPRSVADIPILARSEYDQWVIAALQFATPSRDRSARSRPRRPRAAAAVEADTAEAAAEAGSAAADARTETPERERAMLVGSTLQEAPEQITEQETPSLIGPEVRRGLARLRRVTIGQAVEAVGRRSRRITSDSSGERRVRTYPGANAETSLLQATGMVYFIGNRLYVLDRTGHITGTDFHFTLEGASLRRGGAYFFGRFALGHEGSEHASGVNLLLDITSGSPTVTAGDIYPRNVITGLVPLMQRQRQVLGANAGIAIFVSSRAAESQQTLRDFSPSKVRRAVTGAIPHLEWAVRTRIRQAIENPGQEIFNQLVGLATTELMAALPPVRAPLLAYQVLEEISWLGPLVNIAGYARTADEINLVSQEIARRVVDEIASRLLGGVVRVGRGLAGRRSGRSSAERDQPEAGRAVEGVTRPGTPEAPARPAAPPEPAAPGATPPTRPAAPPAERAAPAATPPEPARLPPPETRPRRPADAPIEGGEGGRVLRFPSERARRPGEPREAARQRQPAEREQVAEQEPELRSTGTEGAPPPAAAGGERTPPVGVVRQPPPVASGGGRDGGGTRTRPAATPPPAAGGEAPPPGTRAPGARQRTNGARNAAPPSTVTPPSHQLPAAPSRVAPPSHEPPGRIPSPVPNAAAQVAARRQAAQQRLQQVESELARERSRVARAREGMSKAAWAKARAGQTKRLYNLLERRYVLRMAQLEPGATFLEQARIVGVDVGGTITPATQIAGGGRIADWARVDASRVVLGDLKSPSAQVGSVRGGIRRGPVAGQFRSTSAIGRQHARERRIINHARQNAGKVIIRGRNVVTGETVDLAVDPARIGPSRVTDYQSLPDN